MEQLLAHLVGDYILQNHWMANTKTRSSIACLMHVLLYGLPFLLITQSPSALAVIVGTHFVIDRFRLANYWIDFWGTGKVGWVTEKLVALRGGGGFTESYLNFNGTEGRRFVLSQAEDGTVLTFMPDKAPPFLSVWLLILVDNTVHLCINYAALAYWSVT